MKKIYFMLLPILALMASCEEKQPETQVSDETVVTDSTEVVSEAVVIDTVEVDTAIVE